MPVPHHVEEAERASGSAEPNAGVKEIREPDKLKSKAGFKKRFQALLKKRQNNL